MTSPDLLAIDAGGSHTRAGLYDSTGVLLAEAEGPGANPVAYGVEGAIEALTAACDAALARAGASTVRAIAAGISGCGGGAAGAAIAKALCARFGAEEAFIGGDGWPTLYGTAGWRPAILVISGTGCTVFVHPGGGATFNIGGRGTLWGEDGGAYGLACAGLRAAGDAIDGLGPATTLIETLPAAAGCPSFDAFIRWGGPATKADVAALAQTVLAAAETGDGAARRCVEEQASILAGRIAAGLRKGALADDAPIVYSGSLIDKSSYFRSAVESKLGRGLIEPALRGHGAVAALFRAADRPETTGLHYHHRSGGAQTASGAGAALDTLDAAGIAETMHRADGEALAAVEAALPALAALIDRAAESISSGGRLVYIGAGTSGRLGVLDASECPPTFGIDADRVIGIIAGGEEALRHSVEGAEDDRAAGAAAIADLAPPLSAPDTVIGIAASGTTPYTLAALAEARRRGAYTALIACAPAAADADRVVVLDTGPEALPGSTRLKAGTATKLALNMISTGAMARAGYVYKGRMNSMRPVNAKLRARAVRIVDETTGCGAETAQRLLTETAWSMPEAVVMAASGCSRDEARRRLAAAKGVLRDALA